MTVARPSTSAALFEAVALRCPGQQAPLSFTLRPGLTLVRGGEGRGKSALLALIAAQAGTLSVWHEQPADAAHDAVLARDWLQQRRAGPTLAPGWSDQLAAALIDAFALADHLEKPMFMLSAGSRRKLGLVGAAASGAQLTLLDVPYAALDGRSARVLSELLLEVSEGSRTRAWVLADYALPAALEGAPLAGVIELGD